MKKMMFIILLLISALSAADIKKSEWFVGGNFGYMTADTDKSHYGEIKFGTYFYDENIYHISNRLYLSAGKLFADDKSKDDILISKVSLDWFINDLSAIFKPFIGVNVGYIAVDSNTNSKIYGWQLGTIFYLTDEIELEFGANIENASDDTIWKNQAEQIYSGVNFSF